MAINFLAIFLAALSTLVVGSIWYNPKVFGTIWMKETGMTKEKMEGSNLIKILGMSVFYAFLMGLILQSIVIHQWSALSIVEGDINNETYKAFMTPENTNAFRTFKHGAFHGLITGLLLIFPVAATNALHEKKSFKYVLVTGGFWVFCLMLMGGIICVMK